MTRLARLLLYPIAVALLAVPGAHAASIAGDGFALDVIIDDGVGGTVAQGPFLGTAGGVADNIFSDPDVSTVFTAGSTDYDFRINWIDDDSFDLIFFGAGAIDLFGLSVTLSGLDFLSGAQPVDIVGAVFNRAASNVDTYNAGPSMPDPSVAFTARSVTATFSSFPLELAADGPTLRFDVQVAEVPEPSSALIVLGGLGLLGLLRWHRR